MPNLGQFASNLGPDAQQAVQQAIARRQQGSQPVAQLSQVTPASQQGQTPQPPPIPQGAPSAVPQGVQAAPTPPPSEAEIIEKALAQRLSSISKVEVAQTTPQQGPQQAPVGGGSVR